MAVVEIKVTIHSYPWFSAMFGYTITAQGLYALKNIFSHNYCKPEVFKLRGTGKVTCEANVLREPKSN